MPKTSAVGILGPTLDRGSGPDRWNHWRPTVSLCQHDDLLIDRFDLLYQSKFKELAEQVTEDIRSVSPETDVRLHAVEMRDPWDFEGVYGELHDFVTALTQDLLGDAETLVHITTGTHVAQICWFLLTESRLLPGKLIQTSPPRTKERKKPGGRDTYTQGPGRYTIIDLDLSKYDKIAQRFESEKLAGQTLLKQGIPTRNTAFNRMIDEIETVALKTRDPILLTGPTGAGKTRLARRVHELKDQRRLISGRFVEVNCATLRGDSAMSALFGHKKGAFTGAIADRKGLLAEASGGLLFLDEIGELGLDEQAMLLHAIEDKRFTPLGADSEVSSDFQLICGTNQDLNQAVTQGAFREDLLTRINLWSFRIPGLAERREDIAPNLAYELERVSQRTGKQVRFNKEAQAAFLRFAESPDALWQGNFRELSAAVTRMSTLAHSARVTADDVSLETQRLKSAWQQSNASHSNNQDQILADTLGQERAEQLDLFDRAQLASVIRVCQQARTASEAGRILFAESRKRRKTVNDADRLRKYLAKFDLLWSDLSENT